MSRTCRWSIPCCQTWFWMDCRSWRSLSWFFLQQVSRDHLRKSANRRLRYLDSSQGLVQEIGYHTCEPRRCWYTRWFISHCLNPKAPQYVSCFQSAKTSCCRHQLSQIEESLWQHHKWLRITPMEHQLSRWKLRRKSQRYLINATAFEASMTNRAGVLRSYFPIMTHCWRWSWTLERSSVHAPSPPSLSKSMQSDPWQPAKSQIPRRRIPDTRVSGYS